MSRGPRIPHDHRQVVARAVAAGWTLDQTRGGHLRLRSPDGAVVIFAFTPSCSRAAQNLRADLKRNGLVT